VAEGEGVEGRRLYRLAYSAAGALANRVRDRPDIRDIPLGLRASRFFHLTAQTRGLCDPMGNSASRY